MKKDFENQMIISQECDLVKNCNEVISEAEDDSDDDYVAPPTIIIG